MPLKEIRIKAGEPLELELPLVGTPTPDVIWTKDGAPVNNNSNGWEKNYFLFDFIEVNLMCILKII